MFQGWRCLPDLSVKSGVKNELERGQQTCMEMFLLPRRGQEGKVTFQQPQNMLVPGLGFQGLLGGALGSAGAGQEAEQSWGISP